MPLMHTREFVCVRALSLLSTLSKTKMGTPIEQSNNIRFSFGDVLTFFIVSANEYVLQAQAPEHDPSALAEHATSTLLLLLCLETDAPLLLLLRLPLSSTVQPPLLTVRSLMSLLYARARSLCPLSFPQGLTESAVSTGALLRNIVGLCMEVNGRHSAPPIFTQVLNNLLTAIENIPPSGKGDEQSVAAANGTSFAPPAPLSPSLLSVLLPSSASK